MIVLGINEGHDATAALVADGQILAVTAEERITREKHQDGFPHHAILEVLRIAGIRPKDVDCIAVPHTPYSRLAVRELVLALKGKPPYAATSLPRHVQNVVRQHLIDLIPRKRRLREIGLGGKPVRHIEHHTCHAASAYRTSGLEQATVLTIDGYGEDVSSTVSIGQQGQISRLAQTDRANSIGSFYQAVTEAIGFAPIEGENKTMGLAAYGNPAPLYDFMAGIISCDGLGTHSTVAWTPGELVYKFPGINEKVIFAARLANHSREDLAAACQRRLEDVMVEFVQEAIRRTGIRHLCVAGGVFLNVKANKRILEETDVQEFHAFPDAGDGGNALGAALEVCYHLCGLQPDHRLEHVYYGLEYSDAEIEAELKKHQVKWQPVQNTSSAAAERLARNEVVGWFQGRMEMGPRALGNRSVLANPRDPKMKDRINVLVKKRDWFVPFAPSILEERAAEFLHSYRDSPFMILAFDVKAEKKDLIPAVTHVDGTARPQGVKKDVNPLYWQLISEFERLAGVPVILNTSFNRHGLPIVRSPQDAIEHLIEGNVDVLVIGNYVATRQSSF